MERIFKSYQEYLSSRELELESSNLTKLINRMKGNIKNVILQLIEW